MLVRMSVYLVAIVSGSESVCDVLTICYGSYAEHPLSKFLFSLAMVGWTECTSCDTMHCRVVPESYIPKP